ncbi:MAG: type II toxin-antitoxin system HicA family toxin [Candidatus Micrarchaeota archaeon]
MAHLPRLTGRELVKIVERMGFLFVGQTGSHGVYKHLDGRVTVIPLHAGSEIGPGLLLKIIKKDLGMTREQFEQKIS